MSDKITQFPGGKKIGDYPAQELRQKTFYFREMRPQFPLIVDLPAVIRERLDVTAARMNCSPERAAEAFIIWGLAQAEGQSLVEFTQSLDPGEAQEGAGVANVVRLTSVLRAPAGDDSG